VEKRNHFLHPACFAELPGCQPPGQVSRQVCRGDGATGGSWVFFPVDCGGSELPDAHAVEGAGADWQEG
jgi:hypothetical protein